MFSIRDYNLALSYDNQKIAAEIDLFTCSLFYSRTAQSVCFKNARQTSTFSMSC